MPVTKEILYKALMHVMPHAEQEMYALKNHQGDEDGQVAYIQCCDDIEFARTIMHAFEREECEGAVHQGHS